MVATNTPARPRPAGVTALSVFFVFGAGMCALAAALLVFPGTALDAAWRLNPDGHAGFVAMGRWTFLLLGVIGVACAAAAVGLWRNAPSGHRLAIGILAVNLAGDIAGAIVRGDPRSLIGVPIAVLLITYLLRRLRGR